MLIKIRNKWTNIPDDKEAKKMLNEEIERIVQNKEWDEWMQRKRELKENKRKRRKKK